jgi:two-component system, NarL family, sensor histidine kinase DegS
LAAALPEPVYDGALADRLITAEQDERRRLALFLHDGPVQSLSGIALMLDAAVHAVEQNRAEEALRVLASAVQLHRETIRSLRDLSFDLEPVVLRDQGFGPAVRGLTDHLGLAHRIQIDVEVSVGETLAEKAQVALYQIIREGLNQALRRGSPTQITITMSETSGGGIETVIADDGSGERRRASVEAIEERAPPLRGRVRVEHRPDGGTVLRIELPSYTARR